MATLIDQPLVSLQASAETQLCGVQCDFGRKYEFVHDRLRAVLQVRCPVLLGPHECGGQELIVQRASASVEAVWVHVITVRVVEPSQLLYAHGLLWQLRFHLLAVNKLASHEQLDTRDLVPARPAASAASLPGCQGRAIASSVGAVLSCVRADRSATACGLGGCVRVLVLRGH